MQSNNISKYQAKFIEIQKLVPIITKLQRLGELVQSHREINESNLRLANSSMDYFEKLNDELSKQYVGFKQLINPILKAIIDIYRHIPHHVSNPLLEQHACLIIRAYCLYIPEIADDPVAYSDIIYAYGMLSFVKEPKSDFGKAHKRPRSRDYIEKCVNLALFTNTDDEHSLARNPYRAHAVLVFLKSHLDKQWKKKLINKYFVNLVKYTKFATFKGMTMPVYELALRLPEVNPQEILLLFVENVSAHLDNHGTAALTDLISFGEYLKTEIFFSSTEKAFISAILSMIRK